MNKIAKLIAGAFALGGRGIVISDKEPDPFGPVVLKDHDKTISAEPTKLETLGKDVQARPSDDGWVTFQVVDWDSPDHGDFTLDTRDFHVKSHKITAYTDVPSERKMQKNPQKYVHNRMELEQLLNRYYEESGGEGTWRMFTLEGVFRTLNWQMKYIRIYRVRDGFLVCNQDNFIFSKMDLAQPVNKQYLAFSKD